MQASRCALLAWLWVAPLLGAEETPPNTLTDAERSAGWRLLFDGRTADEWRGFKKAGLPVQGWVVEAGCLRHLGKGGGGDLVTREQFDDYEFAFEWRLDAGGNSGVKYFITESRDGAIGHEYQLLGPRSREEALRDLKHATASFYDVLPPNTNALPRAPGEWNQSRIAVRGMRVEHWLNGAKVLEYELGSGVVQNGIAASKFKDIPGFGTKFPHRLLLQDHGGDAAFRNLKVRPLSP